MKGKNKKAISPLISYIILVVIIIGIIPIVYTYLKNTLPQDPLECPDGVSIRIQEAENNSNILTLKIRNNGRFNIQGIILHGSNKTDTLPNLNLTDVISGGNAATGNILFDLPSGGNDLSPGDSHELRINITNFPGEIKSIRVLPLRTQIYQDRFRYAICDGAIANREI